ncbi:hypothetical protein A3K86_21115 [Photobacterium jeanii]|uniref:Outer membrane protein beta-barrel domain-containing protein n=1 Tax=Photobacterium jeanii TaxID=858640 RepID=A0A178K3W2_9GAMM|nr:hypothetical protein [Photobacterium jeanii]OAN11444.1 hypothetical protein A3K86_21115 [Photobacterium jeanii]PST90963.1 hypothetical protein C9I91_10220 [Photobacterium jeanii]
MRAYLPSCSFTAIGLIALLASPLCNANNFSYNYVEAQVITDPGGVGIAGSVPFHEHAHFVYNAQTAFQSDWLLTGGIGFNAPIADRADVRGYLKAHSRKNDEIQAEWGETFSEFSIDFSVWADAQSEVGASIGTYFMPEDEELDKFHLFYRYHATDLISIGVELHLSGLNDGQMLLSARYPLG